MHSHNRYHTTKKASLISAVINLSLAIGKILIGWVGHSQGLVADGVHSLSDLLTDIFVIIAAKFGNEEADEDHPYGHGRIETVFTMALAFLLVLVGLGIAYDAAKDLLGTYPHPTPESSTLIAAIISIIANEFLFRYTLNIGKQIQSQLLVANAWHNRVDSATSFVVVLGIIGGMLGYPHLDAIAAIIVSIFVMKVGSKIAWESIKELIDTGVGQPTLDKIKQTIQSIPGVEALHELRTRSLGGKIFIDVHIIVNPYISVSEGHYIGDHVMYTLKSKIPELADIVVHVDAEDDKAIKRSKTFLSRMALIEKLKTLCHGLPGFEYLSDQNTRFHYLSSGIEVEIILPLISSMNLTEVANSYKKAILADANFIKALTLFSTENY